MPSDSTVTTSASAARVTRGRAVRSASATAGAALAASLLALAGCSTGPATPTISTPTSSTTITEVFSSTVAVGGSKSYAFSTAGSGSVTATLTNIGGTGVPASVIVNLSIGSPGNTGCLASNAPFVP